MSDNEEESSAGPVSNGGGRADSWVNPTFSAARGLYEALSHKELIKQKDHEIITLAGKVRVLEKENRKLQAILSSSSTACQNTLSDSSDDDDDDDDDNDGAGGSGGDGGDGGSGDSEKAAVPVPTVEISQDELDKLKESVQELKAQVQVLEENLCERDEEIIRLNEVIAVLEGEKMRRRSTMRASMISIASTDTVPPLPVIGDSNGDDDDDDDDDVEHSSPLALGGDRPRSESAGVVQPIQQPDTRRTKSLNFRKNSHQGLEALMSKRQQQQEIIKSASYSVMKKNKFGKMQSRVLELDFAQNCLRNLDPDGKELKRMDASTLLQAEKDQKDQKLLRIYFLGDQRPYKVFFSSADDRESFAGKLISLRSFSNFVRQSASQNTYDETVANYSLSQEVGTRIETLSTFIGTWNMGNAAPPDSLTEWIPREAFDIYAIGTQECEYQQSQQDNRNLSAAQEDWGQTLQIHLGPDYVPVARVSLWSINLVVFTRRCHIPKISNVETGTKPTGIAHVCGNKGGVAVSFKFNETSFCFVNCHLAARAERIEERRKNYIEIIRWLRLGLKTFDITNQFQHIFWFGDLNYRVEMPYDDVVRMVGEKRFSELVKCDQLTKEIQAERVFVNFKEGRIDFPPTYRYNRGSRTFSNKRNQAPSYCDRVLWRSLPGLEIEQSTFGAADGLMTSDHSPVYATFSIPTHRHVHVINEDAHPCMVIFKSVRCRVEPPAKMKKPCPYVAFHGAFLESSAESSTMMDTTECQWDDSAIPRVYPYISDRDYLLEQHVLISVNDGNSQVAIGQGSVALRSACDGKAVDFEAVLLLSGKKRGWLRGQVEVRWLDKMWNKDRF